MSKFSMSDLPCGAKIHMIGIGGISMSGLAGMLINFGYTVSGSDAKRSELTDELEAMGAKISIGQRAEIFKTPIWFAIPQRLPRTIPSSRRRGLWTYGR